MGIVEGYFKFVKIILIPILVVLFIIATITLRNQYPFGPLWEWSAIGALLIIFLIFGLIIKFFVFLFGKKDGGEIKDRKQTDCKYLTIGGVIGFIIPMIPIIGILLLNPRGIESVSVYYGLFFIFFTSIGILTGWVILIIKSLAEKYNLIEKYTY